MPQGKTSCPAHYYEKTVSYRGVKNSFKFFNTMKKIEIKGKLSLNKSTIANLNNEQMQIVKGGGVNGEAPADDTAGVDELQQKTHGVICHIISKKTCGFWCC